MKTKFIPSEWMNGTGRRLDCGPYISGAIEARATINALANKQPLHELCACGREGIFHAGREARHWVDDPEKGVPFLGSTDILVGDPRGLPLLDRSQVEGNPRLLIQEGWTLLTRTGTVGRTAFCGPTMKGLACSEHVMRVAPDVEKIQPGYLYAFLASQYGVPMVSGGTYGSIIQSIEPEHIVSLPIPRLTPKIEQAAHDLVASAASEREQHQRLLASATRLFFESVDLRDISATEWHLMGRDLGFTASSLSAQSLRALNFTPRFLRLVSSIAKLPHASLGSLVVPGTLQRGSRFKRIDAAPNYAYQLVGQRELFWTKPEGRWIAKSAAGRDVLVTEGTILIAARGTLGESEVYCRGEFVWGPATQLAYSEDLLRVKACPDKMLPGCLFAFLRSEMAFRMLRAISTGTKMQDHHRAMLSALPIPVPNKNVQAVIHAIVTQAYEARHRAVELEEQAVATVERTILRGGV